MKNFLVIAAFLASARNVVALPIDIVGTEGNVDEASFPLGKCQGDCDRHVDCEGTLLCFSRGGATTIPGCEGYAPLDGTDICWDPNDKVPEGVIANVGRNGNPPQLFPLQRCQGSCVSDEDCADGLVCFFRSARITFVPGCDGEPFPDGADYCVDPNDIDSGSVPGPRATSAPVPVPVSIETADSVIEIIETIEAMGEPTASPVQQTAAETSTPTGATSSVNILVETPATVPPTGSLADQQATEPPVVPVTSDPTASPVATTPAETDTPVALLTEPPTTDAPVDLATEPPVTDAPIDIPTEPPVETDSPVTSPTDSPTETPIIELPDNFLSMIYNGGSASNASLPLQNCQGDCDSDTDCADGLVCLSRNTNEPVPGCVGFALDFFDYCVEPDATVIESEEPVLMPPPGVLSMIFSDGSDASVLPLQVRNCKGLCPSMLLTQRASAAMETVTSMKVRALLLNAKEMQADRQHVYADCAEGLVCFFRTLEEVPGCSGIAVEGTDYCIKDDSPPSVEIGDNNVQTDSTSAVGIAQTTFALALGFLFL